MSATAFPELRPDDVVIAVMGITGAGKSTFVKNLVDQEVRIGHNLNSCTEKVEIYSFIYRHTRRVFLVDTPGFDDSNKTDTEILKEVAYFLSQIYERKILLSGIVYLHRITDMRMSGSSIRNLAMFKELCGENAYQHVVLATTMWGNLTGPGLSYDVGVEREQELVRRKDWWGLMHQRGSLVIRHTNDERSALGIVDYLVGLAKPVLLTIQKEMVDEHKTLEDTRAGQMYEKELNEMKKLHKAQLENLKEGYEQALKDRDEELAEVLRSQRQELEDKLKAASHEQAKLKVTLEQIAKEKAEQYEKLLKQMEEDRAQTARLLAEREADLKRFDQDRKKEKEARKETDERYAAERRRLEDRIHGLEAQSQANSDAAERHQDTLRTLADLQAKLAAQRSAAEEAARQDRIRLQKDILEAQVAQAEQARQAAAQGSKHTLMRVLTGIGVMVGGVLTANPAVWSAGAAATISAVT